ncbi:hypothetical protein LC593_22665 [Nostoc sp. CHAB 5844]|nr:hypothetical protein [Nostoc sp. CHAB 5844]
MIRYRAWAASGFRVVVVRDNNSTTKRPTSSPSYFGNGIVKKFKMFCLEKEIDNSQGLEDLLAEYFSWKESQQNQREKSA